MTVAPEEPATPADRGALASSLLARVRVAAGFLTILPTMPQGGVAKDAVGASFAWFPLVGLAIGAALVAEDRVLAILVGPAIRSTLIVLSLAVLTGAVHLDAVADTADALGAGGDRERALAILRDSRIGSFGAVALFFLLALKVLALASMTGSARVGALVLAPALGRWAMVAVSYRLDYLRACGAASPLQRESAANLAIATLTIAAAALVLHSWAAVRACVCAIVVLVVARWFYLRWVGGVTGDLIGACGEIVETLVLVAMAS